MSHLGRHFSVARRTARVNGYLYLRGLRFVFFLCLVVCACVALSPTIASSPFLSDVQSWLWK